MASSARVSLLVCALLSWLAVCQGDLTNTKVLRGIDLSSQVATYTTNITVQNDGVDAVTSFHFLVADPEHLSFITASGLEDAAPLEVHADGKLTVDSTVYGQYRVELGRALRKGESASVSVRSAAVHQMRAHPRAVPQGAQQQVVYLGSHYFVTPYRTVNQRTTLTLASAVVEAHSELAPTQRKGDSLTYGPYKDVAPLAVSPLRVHFTNNKPFVAARTLLKHVEVSHWGNVAVEQSYDLVHTGAELKGFFSRFDYQRQPPSPAHLASLHQTLPRYARDLYLRDDIGNISTSHAFTDEDGYTTLDARPRTPLFGGWSTSFYFGYNLPATNYLFSDPSASSTYVLRLTLSNGFDEIVADSFELRIVLPEGASDVKLRIPYAVESIENEKFPTYLDTTGRTVVVAKLRNVVPSMSEDFEVSYRFTTSSMLRKPLLLIAGWFTVLFAIIIYQRVAFFMRITDEDAGSSSSARALHSIVSETKKCVQAGEEFDDALIHYVRTKDKSAYNVQSQKYLKTRAKALKQIGKMISQLDDASTVPAKDLERRERELHDKRTVLHGGSSAAKSTRPAYERLHKETVAVIELLEG